MAQARRSGIRIRKLADYSKGRRVDGAGEPLEAWPLLGVTFTEPPAEKLRIPEHVIVQGYREGWVELEGVEQVTRPAGPHHAPWAGKAGTNGQNHSFLHAKAVIFHMVEGDFRYAVAANPDKQHVNLKPSGADETGGGEVWHHYDLDLEAAPKQEKEG